MIGTFGSFVADGLTVGQDLVDLIFEQECLRNPGLSLKRETFGLINFNLTAPAGTIVEINKSEYCRPVINETRQLIIPVDFFIVKSCVLQADCAGVNCRYLYQEVLEYAF